jgi:16S rRNA processing protein RimM
MDKYLAIGKILRPHGVKGGVKVRVLSDAPDRFTGLGHIYMKRRDTYERVPVDAVSGEGERTVVMFKGVADRDAAEALRGEYLYVRRADADSLPEGSNYVCDLIGCVVSDTEGNSLGTLVDVLQTGAADVYIVKSGGKELLFPALKRLLVTIDVQQKRIVVDARVLREVADL